MDDWSLVNYLARAIVSLANYITLQVPLSIGLRIDREVMLSSFSYMSNGERIKAEPWESGPGWSEAVDGSTSHSDTLRAEIGERWAARVNKCKSLLSGEVSRDTADAVNAILQGDIEPDVLLTPGGGRGSGMFPCHRATQY